MLYLSWFIIAVLFAVIAALGVKIYLLKKSINEIETLFDACLSADTNMLVTVSSSDKNIRSLAGKINVQLKELRRQRHRFQQGDTELKNAVTNISHDLRTPLTAICGYLDLLEKIEKSAEAERYLDIISERCEVLKNLTDELFRYSVIMSAQEDTPEEIVLNSLLEESLAGFYAVLIGSGITPEIAMPDKPVIRTAGRESLMRVFSNILSNAVKYSDGDLRVELTDCGRIIFENSAENLDEIKVGRLFDRFYTVESASNSTGLGLAIAKTLVEQINGIITAEYANGQLRIIIDWQ